MAAAILIGPEHVEIRNVPVERPDSGEILLRVEAATTCGTDLKVFKRGRHPKMLEPPSPFGHEMAGCVAAIGRGVAGFKEGDAVVVANSAPCFLCEFCKLGKENLCADLQYLNGAFAEFIRVPQRFVERNTHLIPKNLSFEIAALTEPLGCVIHGIDSCELNRYPGDFSPEIIVFGAGPIGLLFVTALAMRNCKVILVDPNSNRLAVGKKMGAFKTVLIEREGNQESVIKAATNDQKGAQIVIDATGVPQVWQNAIKCVKPGGLVNLFGGCAPGTQISIDTYLLHYQELTIKGVYHHSPKTIKCALNMLAKNDFRFKMLLSQEVPIDKTEDALLSMMRRETLKVVIKPGLNQAKKIG